MTYSDIDLGKGFNPWGSHRKLKPDDTTEMLIEEETVLEVVSKYEIIPLWKLYAEIIPKCTKSEREALRSKLMALTVRLVREGKLVRTRSPRGLEDVGAKETSSKGYSYLVLGPSYVPPMQDLKADTKDLSRSIRDVDSAGGVVEERGPILESWGSCAR